MPLQATSGAASYDAFGGGAPAGPATYIEDVFSTYLYTGTSQPGNSSAYGYLVNNIDLLTKGGMIWTKDRSNNATGTNDNVIVDTLRGTGTWPAGISNSPYMLKTNTTAAQVTMSDAIQGVTTTGYYIGPGNTGVDAINTLNNNYVSWTFREQPKFFDVVTYTGNDATDRQISHALGSAPGCIFVKSTSNTQDWFVNHRALPSLNSYLNLNTTAASTTGFNWGTGGGVAPTSTVFTVGDNANVSGRTYVAYLFAHNAGGFGLTGTDNVISCGSFTSSGSGTASITLGYEPQWVMIKCTTTSDSWYITDTMRGMPAGPATTSPYLVPNTSAAEASWGNVNGVNATGWSTAGLPASQTFIYIAIRRGPMKVPTDGTKVFTPQIATSSGSASNTVTTNFPVDLAISQYRSAYFAEWFDRLRGDSQSTYVRLRSASTAAEATGSGGLGLDSNTGYVDNYDWQNIGGGNYVYWNFQRAPSFFDEVCYTGTGATRTVTHNLAAVPQLIITKVRSSAGYGWFVYPLDATKYMELNSTSAAGVTSSAWNDTAPTSSVFTVGPADQTNLSGATLVAYLFATCAGVSKVFSFTGTGSLQTINCGFTSGARFVLVKRTDSTGDWYVWDSARGISSSTDHYLLLNSTAAEVTSTNWVDTTSTGFQVTAASGNNVNINGATYIGLAIA